MNPDAEELCNCTLLGVGCEKLSVRMAIIKTRFWTYWYFFMTLATSPPALSLPDHTQLPESDGTFVKNFQEHPQSLLLTSSILPVLDALHPDGQYAIGQDSGIYWRLIDPPERGAEAPDWFYVGNVPPLLNGVRRRSYVLWKEIVAPLIAIEFTSGDGSEERDATPAGSEGGKAGKFWVYEQAVRIPFYAIYEVEKASVVVYQLVNGRYQLCPANDRGHYPIPPLGLELGIWDGVYMNQTFPWLRWWDDRGNLLLAAEEREQLEGQRANAERQLAQQERQLAQQERQRADAEQQLAQQERQRADAEQQLAQQERQRADAERERADAERERADQLVAKLRELGIDPNLP
jgi:Uma2 family endonuclease